MHPLVNIAVRAARRAGTIILRATDRLEAVRVAEKGLNDFVTDIDQACEEAIIDVIKKAYPTHDILGEESGSISQPQSSGFKWIIDPIDGTANFIRNIPHFCISIAIEVNGQVEHGVIYDPLKDELFSATRGAGVQLNGTRVRVNPRTKLENAILATGFPFRQRSNTSAYYALFQDIFSQCGDYRRGGSAALDLAYVAAGRLDGYWEMGLKPWDIAAGVLMVTEAGGFVSDFAGNEDYLAKGSVIAASPNTFKHLVHTISRSALKDN